LLLIARIFPRKFWRKWLAASRCKEFTALNAPWRFHRAHRTRGLRLIANLLMTWCSSRSDRHFAELKRKRRSSSLRGFRNCAGSKDHVSAPRPRRALPERSLRRAMRNACCRSGQSRSYGGAGAEALSRESLPVEWFGRPAPHRKMVNTYKRASALVRHPGSTLRRFLLICLNDVSGFTRTLPLPHRFRKFAQIFCWGNSARIRRGEKWVGTADPTGEPDRIIRLEH